MTYDQWKTTDPGDDHPVCEVCGAYLRRKVTGEMYCDCDDEEEAYHTSHNYVEEAERVERMRADNARKLQEDFERAMAPDYSRKGRFQTHNCYVCDHGNKPCVGEKPVCQNMRARND